MISLNCKSWTRCEAAHGCCAKGLFGGKPSRGICLEVCKEREEIPGFVPQEIEHFAAHFIADICRWAATHNGDVVAGNKWLDSFTSKLSSRAAEQLNNYRLAHAPPLHDRRATQIWVNDLINATANKNRGVKPLSLAEADRQWGWHRRAIVPDRVVCLSLETRDDRWKQFTDSCQRSRYLSSWKIERYRARPPAEMIIPNYWKPWNATHYATKADHLQMIEQSYVSGHQTILIFEDDAIIQPDFDDAYEAACASLPSDWMGLWLTSDGHQQSPSEFKPGLMRSKSQLFLHAYMLSRPGMHRFHSHVTATPGAVIDAATSGLMGIEPHFYSTKKNAVIQIGKRDDASPRTEFFNRNGNNVILPPYHGEFGHLILWHTRFVHELKADAKVVCCRRGEELLYPSATGFEYDWKEAGPDASRCGHGPAGVAPKRAGYTQVVPKYANWADWKKFIPRARHQLPGVDVAIGVRKRANPVESRGGEPVRNWQHWEWLRDALRGQGLTVGLVGHPESSHDMQADVKAWDHPDGHTAGSVDLLSNCRLYIGTDTGATHLAAMCDSPTLGFRLNGSGPDFMKFSEVLNKRLFDRLGDDAWNNPELVLQAAQKHLAEKKKISVTVLTGCDAVFSQIVVPTLPGKEAYCERHKLRFANRPYTASPWGSREQLMLEELPRADWLWFLDADTIVMNHAIDIRTVIDDDFDCIIGIDRYGINNGSMLLRNCTATAKFIEDVLELRNQAPNDQIAMNRVMTSTPGYRVKRIGQRAFNSYIETEYGRPDDDRYAYRDGDLLLHFPGMKNERRAELINKYLANVSL